MKTKKRTQAGIEFLTRKAKKTTLIFKVAFVGFGKGFIIDTKSYVMDEFYLFEVGEVVLTELVPINRNGLRIENIRK